MDGSQIYGSTEKETQELRAQCEREGSRGQLAVDGVQGAQFLPRDEDGIPKTGFHQNWWIGLELLHTLFALEHNAIAKQLELSNPTWTSDQIFDTARLVNCALMAKIHTVEWTPGILQHPALQVGMSANWWGLAGEKVCIQMKEFPFPHKVLIRFPAVEGVRANLRQQARDDLWHPRLRCGPRQRALLPHRRVRVCLPPPPADP